jgi:hypothetical protein
VLGQHPPPRINLKTRRTWFRPEADDAMQGSGEGSCSFHFLLVPAKIGKRLWRIGLFGPLLFGNVPNWALAWLFFFFWAARRLMQYQYPSDTRIGRWGIRYLGTSSFKGNKKRQMGKNRDE